MINAIIPAMIQKQNGLLNYVKVRFFSATNYTANSGLALLNFSDIAIYPASIVAHSSTLTKLTDAVFDGLLYDAANQIDCIEYSFVITKADYLLLKSISIRHNSFAWEDHTTSIVVYTSNNPDIDAVWSNIVKVYPVSLVQDVWLNTLL